MLLAVSVFIVIAGLVYLYWAPIGDPGSLPPGSW